MRVALVSDWWAPRIGGIESQLSDLSSELTRRGHTVRVMTTTRDAVAPEGVAIDRVETPMLGGIAVPDPRRIPDLAARIEAHRPDVVHAHGMFSPLAVGAVAASQRIGVASVATVHSLLAPLPVFLAARAIFTVFTNRATILTGVSRAVAADVERASGRSAIVVPNGLDVFGWYPARSGASTHASSEVSVVGVLRLVPKKRPQDLVDAFAVACAANPSVHATLTLVGDGPLRRRLEDMVASRGLGDRVTFAGSASRDAVRAALARASIFAHPGRYEAFGLALLEARAAGVPVVAMDAGGVPELIRHGRTGLLASSQREFADALSVLLADAAMRRRFAEEAGNGLEGFAWPAVVDGYEDVYRRAAATMGAPTKRPGVPPAAAMQ